MIDYNTIREEIKEAEDSLEPRVFVDELPFALDYEQWNLAKKINPRVRNKKGRLIHYIRSATIMADNIASTPTISFGSINQYRISTLPTSFYHLKGTEITEVFEAEYTYPDRTSIISRRFLSKILAFWSKVSKIGRYLPKPEHPNDICGVNLWCDITQTQSKRNRVYHITGHSGIQMLLDFLNLIRDKPKKLSEQMILCQEDYANRFKTTKEIAYSKQRKALYHIYDFADRTWMYPRINPTYLVNLIKELSSGRYDLEYPVPLIQHIHTKPLKCTDMHMITSKDEESKVYDDYDLTQYVFERS